MSHTCHRRDSRIVGRAVLHCYAWRTKNGVRPPAGSYASRRVNALRVTDRTQSIDDAPDRLFGLGRQDRFVGGRNRGLFGRPFGRRVEPN